MCQSCLMPRSVIIVRAFLTFYFNIIIFSHSVKLLESSEHVRCNVCASQAGLSSSSSSLVSPLAFSSRRDVTSVEMVNLDTSKRPQPIQPLAHAHSTVVYWKKWLAIWLINVPPSLLLLFSVTNQDSSDDAVLQGEKKKSNARSAVAADWLTARCVICTDFRLPLLSAVYLTSALRSYAVLVKPYISMLKSNALAACLSEISHWHFYSIVAPTCSVGFSV